MPAPMLPTKTDKGRQALALGKTASLSLTQRRALILCDGRRDLPALVALLGADAPHTIAALVRDGYLAAAVEATTPAARTTGRLGDLLRVTSGALQSRRPIPDAQGTRAVSSSVPDVSAPTSTKAAVQATTHASALPATSAAAGDARPATAPRPRRSLAASKMYVLDLLQLQRDLRMAECRTEIQCAQDTDEIAAALLAGVRHLLRQAPPGYGQRVIERLSDILPEEHLPALRALQSELSGKPVLAVTNAA